MQEKEIERLLSELKDIEQKGKEKLQEKKKLNMLKQNKGENITEYENDKP